MEFEWHEAKRAANLDKHFIDFIDAITIWNGEVVDPVASRRDEGEERHLALGAMGMSN